MAKMIQIKAQTRAKMAQKVLDVINEEGQDNIIEVIMDEGGKFASGGLLASIRHTFTSKTKNLKQDLLKFILKIR